MTHRILIGLSVLALAACQQPRPAVPAAPVEAAPVAEAAPPAATPITDPVAAFVDRAEGCVHFAGEPAYDAQRQADITEALAELNCDGLSADAATLKAAVSGDAAAVKRIDEAIDGWG